MIMKPFQIELRQSLIGDTINYSVAVGLQSCHHTQLKSIGNFETPEAAAKVYEALVGTGYYVGKS